MTPRLAGIGGSAITVLTGHDGGGTALAWGLAIGVTIVGVSLVVWWTRRTRDR